MAREHPGVDCDDYNDYDDCEANVTIKRKTRRTSVESLKNEK